MGKRIVACAVFAFVTATSAAAERPLQVVTTLPDLASIVRSVGGDAVVVEALVKGTEDPHFVEARPSFVKLLHQADLFVQAGLDLESSWVTPLLRNARNPSVLPSAKGYLDASQAIQPLEVPGHTLTRAMGDVHQYGNPHYLLDPLNGRKVAALIRDKLTELRPSNAAQFQEGYQRFSHALDERLVGPILATKYPVDKLAALYARGKLIAFLTEQGETQALGGWLGKLAPLYGMQAVDEHNLWPYFTERFGFRVFGHFEPKPGVPPTTQHLMGLVEGMQRNGVKLVFTTPYFDPRHARLVADTAGARIVPLAHQVGARPNTDDYLAMFDYNVNALLQAAKR